MNVSIIVPIYAVDIPNGDLAARFLTSVRRNTEPGTYELIAVDNDCAPEALERFDRIADTTLHLSPNRGFSGGTNAGIRAAFGDVLVIGSADVFVHPGWLPPLVAAAIRNDGLASPMEPGPDGKALEETEWRAKWRGNFWGVLWAMPRHCLETVGYLDEENFLVRWGDADYAIRAHQAGHWVGRVPESLISHPVETMHHAKHLTPKSELRAERDRFIARYGANEYAGWIRKGDV